MVFPCEQQCSQWAQVVNSVSGRVQAYSYDTRLTG